MDEGEDLEKKTLEQSEDSEESPHSTFSNLANTNKQSFPSSDEERKPFENSYQFASERKKSKKTLYLVILLIIVLSVVAAFIFNKKSSKQAELAPSPTPIPTATQTPKTALNERSSSLNKADWSLEVLNGSGVSGLAKKVADKLKEMGYRIVKTANADKDSYDKTQILVKKDLQDRVDLLIADLKDVIKIASVAGELKDSTASARIILGKD